MTSKFKIVPPKKWQILESGQGGTERRKKYLANCSAVEVEVRKLIKYHKIEIKRAKAHLQEFPESQHWHFSCRLCKASIRENKFYIKLLRKMLPHRKSWWKQFCRNFRCIFSKRGNVCGTGFER